MGIKTLIVCDGCDKELKNKSERYYLYFRTDSFLDAAGDIDYNTIDLVFCEHCAKHIKSTFEKILERLNEKEG